MKSGIWKWTRTVAGFWGGAPVAILLWIPPVVTLLLLWKPSEVASTGVLLSSLVQGLATVLAIVLSAVLFSGQLSARYGLKLLASALGSPFMLIEFSFLAAGIAMGLVALGSPTLTPVVTLSKAALAISLLSLLLLLPFFRFVHRRLSPQETTRLLVRNALRTLRAKGVTIPSEIYTLYQLYRAFLEEHDYENCLRVIMSIADLFATLLSLETQKADRERGREVTAAVVGDPSGSFTINEIGGLFQELGKATLSPPVASHVHQALGAVLFKVEDKMDNKTTIRMTQSIVVKLSADLFKQQFKSEELKGSMALPAIVFKFARMGIAALYGGKVSTALSLGRMLRNLSRTASDHAGISRQAIFSVTALGHRALETTIDTALTSKLTNLCVCTLDAIISSAFANQLLPEATLGSPKLCELALHAIKQGNEEIVIKSAKRLLVHAYAFAKVGRTKQSHYISRALTKIGREASLSGMQKTAGRMILAQKRLGEPGRFDNIVQKAARDGISTIAQTAHTQRQLSCLPLAAKALHASVGDHVTERESIIVATTQLLMLASIAWPTNVSDVVAKHCFEGISSLQRSRHWEEHFLDDAYSKAKTWSVDSATLDRVMAAFSA